MKVLVAVILPAILICLPGCDLEPAERKRAQHSCRSQLDSERDACADVASEALLQIRARREKRFQARDDCSMTAARGAEVDISFFSALLNPLDYPTSQRTGGVARLRMHVDASGQLQTVDIVQSSGNAAQDVAAVERVWDWCYVPAHRDGFDAGGSVEHVFSFETDES